MIDVALQSIGEFPLEDVWSSTLGYTVMFITVLAGVATLASGTMTVGALTAYITFIYIATTATGMPLLTNVAYVTLTIICLGIGFKIYRAEGWG